MMTSSSPRMETVFNMDTSHAGQICFPKVKCGTKRTREQGKIQNFAEEFAIIQTIKYFTRRKS